jgi:hypothetical protein
MLDTERATKVQRPHPTKLMTAAAALALARERFPNLTAIGILGRKYTGPPIDPAHVTIALRALSRCRERKTPCLHTHDLVQAIGVSQGAIICACVALGFAAHGWLGSREFFPGAMTNVDRRDV